MKRKPPVNKFIAVFFLTSSLFYSADITELLSKRSDYFGKTIKEVVFKGNRNTSDADIDSMLELKRGKQLTKGMVDRDLKTLFASGFFYFIDIQAEDVEGGVKIIVELKERPRVKEIEFVGADEVFPADLREKMPLKDNEVITPQKVSKSRDVILQKYRDEGFFLAYVKAELGKPDPKTNLVKVRFVIDEGEEIPVAKINVYGNETIETSELLGLMDLKEEGLFEGGSFKESSFEKDKEVIQAYMRSKGYLDSELLREGTNWEIHWENPEKKDRRVIIVNIKLYEGQVYYFNGYSVAHDMTLDNEGRPVFLNKEKNPPETPKDKLSPLFTVDEIEKVMDYSVKDVGEIFDETVFMRDRSSVNELYGAKGHIFAQVIPRRKIISLDEESLQYYENCYSRKTDLERKICEDEYKQLNIRKLREVFVKKTALRGRKFVHVDFTVRENNLAKIENVIIKGNKKTQDKVIRRELLFKPGDLFDSTKVNRSRERIHNLGYFKEVNFNMRPGSDDSKMNIVIEVLEQPTGTVSMGGGYGTITGFTIFTEVGENNLNGTGQKISGRIEFGPYRRSFQISWTEPWLNDTPWSLSLSLFYFSRTIFLGSTSTIAISDSTTAPVTENATYDNNGLGVTMGIAHRVFTNWTHFHRYTPAFYSYSNPTALVSDAVLANVRQGWQFRSQISNGISFDIRDNVFAPTRGYDILLQVDNVGQYLGGSSHFDQYRITAEYYHTWFDFTFGGLIRNNSLRRWRVVQEFRTSDMFTFQRSPKYGHQDPVQDPYIRPQDLLIIGGYESLRGWYYNDPKFPTDWRSGAQHRILFDSEIRIPIEPSLLWLVVFLDGGALYEQVNRFTGVKKDYVTNYDKNKQAQILADPVGWYLQNNFNLSNGKKADVTYDDLNNPARLVLSSQNVAMDRMRYSWGIGLRIQIPVLPLRIYFAQKIRPTGNFWAPFERYEDDRAFQFVFGIGDYRF
ncbi:outer membrane protein, OMP85 family [Leptospira inadai serovar Lyme str. 10]|uniref:Outer membrane protein, OMP85 family n=2 Tax=Leptospira inadai serovar Lyme TaxID=293084 RepID=V6HI14_9LEPT|nr:POTRA domain-containing protein [Leptospira inadai]EQA36225.1 outer membrane protein, OMP85 family [Leptospira inadai serovar Lyme str. 10]PNV74867.1 peptide-binding protein [Leptospira inadai serovar Lyme]